MLTDKQKQFLINYLPEDSMFTSQKEIEIITHHLGTNKEIRNDVVKFYRNLMESENILTQKGYYRTAKYDNYMIAMQSVVAAIDFNF